MGASPRPQPREWVTEAGNQGDAIARIEVSKPERILSFKARSKQELKGAVYDVAAGKDTFSETTRKVAEYVSRQYDDAGEFRTGMVQLELEPLVEPTAPADNATAVKMELWKMARRTSIQLCIRAGTSMHRYSVAPKRELPTSTSITPESRSI
jgi:hypothetical protein